VLPACPDPPELATTAGRAHAELTAPAVGCISGRDLSLNPQPTPPWRGFSFQLDRFSVTSREFPFKIVSMPDSNAASPVSVVLVVDDDTAVLHSLTALFESHGIPIITARDGLEGLDAFRRLSPAVVLTDILMPEQDGIGAIMEMRRERPAIKIIAMSGGGRIGKSDFLTVAKKLGADAVIQKPIDPDGLVKLLGMFLHTAG
jgi:CheY-like chemotaxis protein